MGDPSASVHLLRRLKTIATRAKVENATLHKFRHTYATRLQESGADIVTVQKFFGDNGSLQSGVSFRS
jgi:site-specific recombinase XerD